VKRTVAIACVFVLLIPCLCLGETWEEFVKMREKAEAPKMIPKGGLKPDLIPKDVIIQRINQGQPVEFNSDAILFEYGLAKVRPECMPQVTVISDSLKDPRLGHVPKFYVDGHTCSIGSDANNCRLSWERANQMVRLLVDQGVPQSNLVPRGFGKNHPAYANEDENGRRKNRRVVLCAAGDNRSTNLTDAQVCKEWTPPGGAARYGTSDTTSGAVKPSGAVPARPSASPTAQTPPGGTKDIPKGFTPR